MSMGRFLIQIEIRKLSCAQNFFAPFPGVKVEQRSSEKFVQLFG
jgi:hypothetical protein